MQIAINALLYLHHTALHLRPCEVVVAGIDRLKLAAVNGDARFRKQVKLAAQGNKLGSDLTDRFAVVFTEVRYGLVIRNQTTNQPHHFHVALALHLKAAARLDLVEIAIDIELQ